MDTKYKVFQFPNSGITTECLTINELAKFVGIPKQTFAKWLYRIKIQFRIIIETKHAWGKQIEICGCTRLFAERLQAILWKYPIVKGRKMDPRAIHLIKMLYQVEILAFTDAKEPPNYPGYRESYFNPKEAIEDILLEYKASKLSRTSY